MDIMAEIIIPKDASTNDPIKVDDAIVLIKVPRDFSKLTVSPKVPPEISALIKTRIGCCNFESEKTTPEERASEAIKNVTSFVIGTVIAKERLTEMKSRIAARPDVEVEEITPVKEAAMSMQFAKLVDVKKSAEDCRTQQELPT